ncbi:hypothetical protein B484DRAFT_404157 [Ochromonadaceae sp. CCMP2298]|nr:hypothetical protein B484DRAFT_404157 [Ochromonadaceae sp. CCMP2298]
MHQQDDLEDLVDEADWRKQELRSLRGIADESDDSADGEAEVEEETQEGERQEQAEELELDRQRQEHEWDSDYKARRATSPAAVLAHIFHWGASAERQDLPDAGCATAREPSASGDQVLLHLGRAHARTLTADARRKALLYAGHARGGKG